MPASHSFEQAVFYITLAYGMKCGFYGGDTRKLMEDLAVLKPTIFPSVPRLFNKIHGLQRPSSNYSVASVAILSPCDFGGRMCHPPPIMTSLALGDEQSAGCSSSL